MKTFGWNRVSKGERRRRGGREETGASGPREAGTEEGYGQRKGPGPESGAHWRPLVVHC